MRIGAYYHDLNRCEFVVWAPFIKEASVKIISPAERIIPMSRNERGYWQIQDSSITPGTLYLYNLAGISDRPDPASHFQPQGVHSPSQVIDHGAFQWNDAHWPGIPLSEMIIYELHIGTFTPEGTCSAIIPRLSELRELGVNAIELMPIIPFPGERNWGYDGVFPFAVHQTYGGPEGLKKLVNACHQLGIAVILDVVYNHLGPEGNYLAEFGPYFTDKYQTPWGTALNFDDTDSDGGRNFFLENARHWFRNYHVDALRLDAIHAIYDRSARPFLQELAEAVAEISQQHGRKLYLIAESDLNDVRVIRSKELGGHGIDAQWCDDFHHALHALLTNENQGYYMDFGQVSHLVKAFKEGFVYSGQYSAYRKRHHGTSAQDEAANRFIVFAQNHDQIGNRMMGERLSMLISFEALKLAAGAFLLSPYIPLIFMGEEYGEESPFLYFVSYDNPDLIASVRAGRQAEFEASWQSGKFPDPQEVETFLKSKLKWEQRYVGKHRILLEFYKRLISMRKQIPALSNLDKNDIEVSGLEQTRLLFLRRKYKENQTFSVLNFNKRESVFHTNMLPGKWRKIIDSAEEVWIGPGSLLPERIEQGQKLVIRPLSFALYEMEMKGRS